MERRAFAAGGADAKRFALGQGGRREPHVAVVLRGVVPDLETRKFASESDARTGGSTFVEGKLPFR